MKKSIGSLAVLIVTAALIVATTMSIASGEEVAPNLVNTASIQDGAVTTPKLADESVTSQKIGGVISVEKLGTYAQQLVVHKGAANGVNTFNTITEAINSLNASSPVTLIKVMPGVYEESLDGANSWNIFLEGSGRGLTTIVGSVNRIKNVSKVSINGSVWAVSELTDSEINGPVQGYGTFRMSNCAVNNGTVSGIMVAVIKNCVITNGSISVSTYSWVDIQDVNFESQSNNPDAYITVYGYAGNGNPVFIRNVTSTRTGAPPANAFHFAGGVNAKIYNSTLQASTNGVMLDSAPTNIQLVDSKLVTPGPTFAGAFHAANTILVENSRISDTVTDGNLGTTTIINCVDGQYRPLRR